MTGTWTYDALGRAGSQGDPIGTFSYAYAGTTSRLQQLTYSNGQTSTDSYLPNTGDRRVQDIHHQTAGGGTLSRFSYAYDAVGNIGTWTQQYEATMRAYDFPYDAADQLTAATYRTTDPTPTVLTRYGYGYDAVGNRTGDQIDEVATTGTHDVMNRRTARVGGGLLAFAGTVSEPATVTVQGTPAVVDSGNRFTGAAAVSSGTTTVTVAATDASGNTRTQAYEVDAASSSSTLTYDANGNLATQGSKTYDWDATDRLVTVKDGATALARFAYDGFGRRAQKVAGGVTRSYVYDGEDILEERINGGATSRHVHGPGIDQPLATVSGGAVGSYYLADHLGSIVQTTNTAGQVTLTRQYDPFGRLLAGNTAQGYAFTGREWDPEIELYYYRARYFSPTLGRFVSADPIRLLGGPNRYAYARNNPISWVDPLGLCDEPPDDDSDLNSPEGEENDSVTRSLQEAIKRGNPAEIRNILDAAGDVISPTLRQATQKALARLETKAKDIIARELKGSVNNEFPDQLRESTLERIMDLARRGDEFAIKARKLLTDSRFRK